MHETLVLDRDNNHRSMAWQQKLQKTSLSGRGQFALPKRLCFTKLNIHTVGHKVFYVTLIDWSASGYCKLSAVNQAVGCCCLDAYGAHDVVWSNPDTRKATASYLCMCPTTQPLHQGSGKLEKQGQKSRSPSGATNLACRVQGCRFNS